MARVLYVHSRRHTLTAIDSPDADAVTEGVRRGYEMRRNGICHEVELALTG